MTFDTPALWTDPAFKGPHGPRHMKNFRHRINPLKAHTMKKTLIAATLLASLGAAQADASIVVNGSFEAQAQAAGTSSVYQTLPGWTTTGGSGIELRNQLVGNASDGSNFVELDSYSNSAMAQTLTTLAGALYTLSFDYSARAGVGNGSNHIQVLWNGASVATVTADGSAQSGNDWLSYSYSVLGTGSDVLSFRAIGVSDSLGGSLDAVAVTAAVPEPSTYAMLFAGLALIGFSLRRRRSER